MPAEIAHPTLTLNPVHDVNELLEYHFMINALLAGGIVAVMAGLVGWLTVMRRETFAGHTLSLMAFPGASGAALIGVPVAWGYFACCGAGALAISRFSDRATGSWDEESAGIGTVQALALALGFLFLSLYSGVLDSLESLLFGNPLGVSDGQVRTLAIVGAVVLLALGAVARPLLFASVDPDVADARGVPVKALSTAFLLLLGLAVAATSQITGPLLVFALLVMPAATAQAITPRPLVSLLLTVVLGLAVVWLGMSLAYFSVYPAACFITATAFAIYALARLHGTARRRRSDRRPPPAIAPQLPDGVIA
jgi:zinc/manganese transport system permease protein